MDRYDWRTPLTLGACCLVAFTISFLFIYSAVAVWLLTLAWLISGNYKGTFRRLISNIPFWLWLVYFVLHAAGYFYSKDVDQSLFDTVGKLSFIVLPILIASAMQINLRDFGSIVISFVSGLLLTEIYCLWHAHTLWVADNNTTHFFYHELTRGLEANAVYLAWYVTGALAALLLFPWREAGLRWVLWVRWPVVLLFTLFVILLASRLMLLVYPIIILPAFGLQFSRRYKYWIIVPFLALIIGFGGLFLLARTENPIRKRFSDIMHPDMETVMRDDYKGVEPPLTNLTLRLFIWRIALENMETHNLWWRGTGNGDAHHYQNKRIAGHGIPNMREGGTNPSDLYKVNLHNMYLQSLLMFGIPGLVIFISIVLAPFLSLRRAGQAGWFFAVFHLTSLLFFLQESALQTQAGVIYYCFFSATFFAVVKSHQKGALQPANQKVIQR